MKRGMNLILGVVLIVFFINFISALTTSSFSIGTLDTCDNVNKIIMRMSSSTNAHGEIYSNTNYNIVLCGPVANEQACDYYCSGESTECDSIEGKNSCEAVYCNWKARNKIIGLSSETNAHAESPYFYNYGVDVCYGDLTCMHTAEPAGTCDPGGAYPIQIASISSPIGTLATNSHIGKYADYDTKICCAEGYVEPFCGDNSCNGYEECGDTDISPECNTDCGACPEPRAYWGRYSFSTYEQRMTDNPDSILGQTLYLIYENEALLNTNIEFNLWERDYLINGEFTEDDYVRGPITKTTDNYGTAFYAWTITQDDIDKVYSPAMTENDKYEFEFIANGKPSGILDTTISESGIDSCISTEYCSNYDNPAECGIDRCGVATASVIANSPDNSANCDGITSFCYCEWNETESECGPYVGYVEDGVEIGSCHYNEDSSDDCDDGLLSYSWKGIWTWGLENSYTLSEIQPPSLVGISYFLDPFETGVYRYDSSGKRLTCLDGSNTVVCPAQIQLPFFSAYNLVIAIVLIVLIYFLILKNSKKRVGKGK